MEVWKEILGSNGYYVSSLGRVRRGPKIISPVLDNNKYTYVSISFGKTRKKMAVHRLVATYFCLKESDKKNQVNHINGIRTDNRAENLEWVSPQENITHSYNVLHRKANKPWDGKLGEEHPLSKVVLQIKDGIVVAEFFGTNEASRKTKIRQSNISMVCNGQRKTAGGYTWTYLEGSLKKKK